MYHATSIVRDTIVFMCSMAICVLLPSTYMMCGFLDMGKIRVVRKKGYPQFEAENVKDMNIVQSIYNQIERR